MAFNSFRVIPFSAWLAGALSLLLAACASDQPAPVVERIQLPEKKVAAKPAPQPAVPSAANTGAPAAQGKDWRPERYTVKKGDTLFSIGLEYGYDYKELAQLNNLPPPYVIRIGQQLMLHPPGQADTKSPAATASPGVVTAPLSSNDGSVVVRPLSPDGSTSPVTETPSSDTASAAPPSPATGQPAAAGPVTLSEPKAKRIPYSDQAMQAAPPGTKPGTVTAALDPSKPVDATAKPGDTPKPADAAATKTDSGKVDAAKPAAPVVDEDSVNWTWPTSGKVISGFSEGAGNTKGIDIGGSSGQAVVASAPGKVIYSGSDLRGYGKLVIIKHNKTYLSVYAHNSQIFVKEGQQVIRGQKIAEMGDTDTDRVKLHFEIRQQGKSVDPSKLLPVNPG